MLGEVRVTENLEAMVRDAQRLQGLNLVAEAIAAHQRVLLRWPNHSNSWFNLGVLFRKARRLDEALVCYQKALNLGISNPEEVHLNRGVIYADYLRQDAAAERELQAALALSPGYIPALLNLANIHEDRGRRDEAQGLYRQILALDPQDALALTRYANMQSPSDCDAALVAQLQRAIGSAEATDEGRANLGFALGRVLDARGAYDEAFTAYATANSLSRASAAPGTARYDRREQEQYIDRLIEAGAPPSVRTVAADRRGPRPIFVCGMFRSGSTMAEQLLAEHPGVAAGSELDLLPSWVAGELAPYPEALGALSGADLERLARRYLATTGELFPGATHVTDKRPDNFLYIGLIKLLFPDAKIVHTTRDPLDNCLSIFFLHLDQRMSYATDLLDIGHYYREYRRLMIHWKRLFGADIIDLNYDHFVREPHIVAPPVFEALGLRWDPRFLGHARSGRSVQTASVWQVREPLYRRSSGRSQHYARQLAPLRDYLADLLPN